MRSTAPIDIAAMRKRILDERHTYSRQITKVLAQALANPETIAFGTLRSVADICGVSPGTVLRSLRALDFESFAEFKKPFQDVLRTVDGQEDKSVPA